LKCKINPRKLVCEALMTVGDQLDFKSVHSYCT